MNTERRARMRTEREKRREGRGCMDVHLPHPILILACVAEVLPDHVIYSVIP